MVTGEDSCFEGHGFEYQHCILDGHFFKLIWCENCIDVCLKMTEINKKEAGNGPIKYWDQTQPKNNIKS